VYKRQVIERLRITRLGNVGIGTTNPLSILTAGTGSGTNAITINGANSSTSVNQLVFAGGGSGNPSAAIEYDAADPGLVFQVGNYLTLGTSERARIDSSGRLLVGTSTSAGEGAPLQIRSDSLAPIELFRSSENTTPGLLIFNKSRGTAATPTVVANEDRLGGLVFKGYSGAAAAYLEGARIQAFVDGEPDTSGDTTDMPGRLVFSTTADGASSPTERMRIGNNGRLSSFTTNDNCCLIQSSAAAGTTYAYFYGYYGATANLTGGTISYAVFNNGNVQNTNNSYGAYSDVKLKENIVDASSQWDDIKCLQVRNYNLKQGQTHRQIGLIAQEVELVSPGLVSESPDRDAEGNDLGTVTKSVNYSVLYMKAVKALQEAMERIETLEAKVAALEGA